MSGSCSGFSLAGVSEASHSRLGLCGRSLPVPWAHTELVSAAGIPRCGLAPRSSDFLELAQGPCSNRDLTRELKGGAQASTA